MFTIIVSSSGRRASPVPRSDAEIAQSTPINGIDKIVILRKSTIRSTVFASILEKSSLIISCPPKKRSSENKTPINVFIRIM